MVRQYPQLNQVFSPQVALKSPKYRTDKRHTHVPNVQPKSPYAYKVHAARATGHSSLNSNRHLKGTTRFAPTHGKRFQDEDDVSHMYRELDGYDDGRTMRHEDTEDPDDLMDWDEETTLVALLQDDVPEEDEREQLAALADQLKAPMSAQGQRLRQYTRDTVVPAIQKVKEVHDTFEGEVDMAYGAGLLTFDEVCKRVENISLRDEDALKFSYIDYQKNTKILLNTLEEAYSRRDKLWIDLEENLEQCAQHAKSAVESLPQEVEDTISRLEKKSKEMEKKGTSVTSKQKMLKGLLERL